jgi:hypothetical protein
MIKSKQRVITALTGDHDLDERSLQTFGTSLPLAA